MTQNRWNSAGEGDHGDRGRGYAARFDALAASGIDVHGEATLCADLVPAGSRILDAGCGTGRVATRLAELDHNCVGVDSDDSMLAVARETSDSVTWLHRDLVGLGDLGDPFHLIVAAGNVIPLLAPGSEPTVISGLADRLHPTGLLLTGFGLDAAHLPLPEAPFGLSDYDKWCVTAGLLLVARYATWQQDPYAGGGYAVSLHRRVPAAA